MQLFFYGSCYVCYVTRVYIFLLAFPQEMGVYSEGLPDVCFLLCVSYCSVALAADVSGRMLRGSSSRWGKQKAH